MHVVSTRDALHRVRPSEALLRGLAPDGGLYVPESFPRIESQPEPQVLAEAASHFLQPFFRDDRLAESIPSICSEAFDFPCPLRTLGEDDSLLELFHGPTAAFKDFGARFLAACLSRLPPDPGEDAGVPRTVLVATSGDTGGAVAAAFAGRDDARVWILYPEGRVSPRQEAQLTCWGPRVRAFAVEGSFDDCQRMVKEAFARLELRRDLRLTSANSINLGRLLPQAAYHWAAAWTHLSRTGALMRPIVPTGNLGHGLAAVWARASGAPIGDIVLALNANRAILDLLESGEAPPRAAIPTLANAMDVGVPSNLERLRHFHSDLASLRTAVRAYSFSDEAIRDEISKAPQRWGFIPCPHTACALLARTQLSGGGWTTVATAHPAKFEGVVEPLIGEPVPLPSALAELLNRPRQSFRIRPSLDELLEATGFKTD